MPAVGVRNRNVHCDKGNAASGASLRTVIGLQRSAEQVAEFGRNQLSHARGQALPRLLSFRESGTLRSQNG
jgi:hypothetical protein